MLGPPDMEGRCEYIEYTDADNQQGVQHGHDNSQ
jgi:hypothetical protein